MKPTAVQALIEDLRAEITESSVGSVPESFAKIEDAASNNSFTLSREECEFVFHSGLTVRNFHEALGFPDDASVELHDLNITSEALEAAERCFAAVDET
jgi:hypothetical protein